MDVLRTTPFAELDSVFQGRHRLCLSAGSLNFFDDFQHSGFFAGPLKWKGVFVNLLDASDAQMCVNLGGQQAGVPE